MGSRPGVACTTSSPGKLEFELAVPGREVRHLPVSVVRSLLEDPQPEVRRAALEGSNRAWERVGDVTAACLNAISGTRHTLYSQRGVPHFLEPALFDAGITRRTLDTLLEVVTARQEVARDYLRDKASLLGKKKLGFQDLMAPLPQVGAGELPWNVAARAGAAGLWGLLSRARRLRRLRLRQALDRLRAAQRQAPRRLLLDLHRDRGVARLHHLQRDPW